MYGELPQSPVIVAACDSKYFMEHAPSFVYSIDDSGDGLEDIHIHVINPTDEVLSLAAILNSTTKARITYTFTEVDVGIFSREEEKTYYSCLRFLIAPVLLKYAKKVLLLGIDCLVTKPIEWPRTDIAYFPNDISRAVYFGENTIDIAQEVASWIVNSKTNADTAQVALTRALGEIKNAKHYSENFNENTKERINRVKEKTKNYNAIILKPRLDIPFKQFGLEIANNNKLPEIRTHWKNFVDKLERETPGCLVVEAPRWFFNRTIQQYTNNNPVYVPHAEKEHFGGDNNCLYYMQTVFPWLFTIDPLGWSGGGSFVDKFDPTAPYDDDAFNALHEYVMNGGSKFKQPIFGWESIVHEVAEPFIFVPLQIPHDETIKYHADITSLEFVAALCKWAETDSMNKPMLVFKGHPINISSMAPLEEIIQKYGNSVYYTDINIHSIIPKAAAVYVINSGTGQESMLHDAQVACFGECEYQGAVHNGSLSELDKLWRNIQNDNKQARAELYRRWYHWYTTKVTYDTISKTNTPVESTT